MDANPEADQTRELGLQLEDLRLLHALSSSLTRTRDLAGTLNVILRHALSAFRAQQGLLSLASQDGQWLRIAASIGFSPEFLKLAESVPAGEGICGRSLTRGQADVFEDVLLEPSLAPYREAIEAGGIRAVHCIPLITREGGTIGVLSVHFPIPHRPSDWAMKFGEVYARLAADSIEQFRLREQAQRESEQRKILEAQRRGTDEALYRLAAIVRSSNDAIISKDLNSIITSWNRGAESIFGYTEQEMIGKSITLLIPANHIDEEPEILHRIRRGETITHYETVRRRKDGSLVDISLTVSPIKDEHGTIIGASKVARDITAIKSTESQLRQAQKMEAVGRLAGGVAHDFNNLLTSIIGFVDLALAETEPGSTIAEYLEEVRKSGNRAANLTQQLLAYSRKQILAPKVVDLNESVSEMAKMLRRLIGEDILFRTTLEPQLGMVKADPAQMQQIIVNLALNARDAMPEGGALIMETSNMYLDSDYAATHPEVKPGPHVMLSVSDSGVGMTPEVQARIFEPFFTTKDVGKGTGLGLSSVYGIIKQSGASIAVTSRPGKGSTFRIYFPLVDMNGQPQPASSAGTLSRPGKGETILLAEDETAVRKFLVTTLKRNGYNVMEAVDGVEALELGRRAEHIDLLLTDMVMPNLNGRALAEALKKERPDLQILFMSGYIRETLDWDRAAGAGFLQKPFSQTDLLARVRELIGVHIPA